MPINILYRLYFVDTKLVKTILLIAVMSIMYLNEKKKNNMFCKVKLYV